MRNKWDMSGADDVFRYIPFTLGLLLIAEGILFIGGYMKDHYEFVKSILERYPETRDDDMKLYARACWEDYGSINPKGVNFYTVLYHHDKYKLPNYKSITRARRRVQQNEEHLRGNRYKDRKNEERKYRNHYGSNQS